MDNRNSLIEAGFLHLCECGNSFTPYRPYQKYCRDKCRLKYGSAAYRYVKKEIVDKECKNCKKIFRSNNIKKRYCSNKCYRLFRSGLRVKKTMRVCDTCGAKFESAHWLKKYCNNDCRKKSRKAV